jgi:xanthine dehydrogenase accessory factor
LNFLSQLTNKLLTQDAVLVCVAETQGSVPRDVGSYMAVFADSLVGTIGGGHLEYQAEAIAKDLLSGKVPVPPTQRVALGPTLGQCCGGVVDLTYEKVTAVDIPRLMQQLKPALKPVALFGGGHVGRALVHVLGALPYETRWIDSRDEVFPVDLPAYVSVEHSDPVQAAVADLVSGSAVLIMSFSHAEDLEVLSACLKRQRERNDLAYIGLIGSASKWAKFRHRLEERGFGAADFERVTTPIGLPSIESKLPEVMAVSVAAQLLQLPETSSTGVLSPSL